MLTCSLNLDKIRLLPRKVESKNRLAIILFILFVYPRDKV